MNESLHLTREIVDQIIFGMENQEREFVLDTEDGTVIPADDAGPEEDRYLDLPEWRSVDGYNLMEQFVATLHNPIYRERLRSILASGRGVFRQFKDTVRERREIERMWFAFKDRRIRELVTEWFNEMREREGLERLEATLTETETRQLLEDDFAFRPAAATEIERIHELDEAAFEEVFPDTDARSVAIYREEARAGTPDPGDRRSRVLVTETQGGDFAGFLWAVVRRRDDVSVAFVQQIYTVPEFRGFGLARELFETFCHRAHDERVSEIQLALYGASLDLEPSFTGYGLERSSTVLRLDVDKWHRAEVG